MPQTYKFKDLKQQTFEVSVDSDGLTVADLKKKIEEVKGFEVERQKLLHAGKVLKDELPLSEYKIEDGAEFIIMLARGKAKKSSAEESSGSAKAESVEALKPAEEKATSAAEPPKSAGASAGAAAAADAAPAPAQASSGGMFENFEQHIESLIAMGFPREQCIRALQAAFGNPDRAVDYLMNGIPEEMMVEEGGAEDSAPTAPRGDAQAAAATAGGETMETDTQPAAPDTAEATGGASGTEGAAQHSGALSFLRGSPQIMQLRAIIQQSPEHLEDLMLNLGQVNPDLLLLINQNQEEFLDILNNPGRGMPQRRAIQVTPEEMAAIQRLEALGFDRARAAEAYLICDKNEELAANYLFDTMNDDQDDQ
eukprot:Clim_evm59s148 gene=Clim_evmTU59s148